MKGFRKLHLEPGAVGQVTFQLDRKDLSFDDAAQAAWRVEPGEFELSIGASSRDIRHAGTFVLPAR